MTKLEKEALKFLKKNRELTLEELVEYLEERGLKEHEAIKLVYQLWLRKRVDIIDPYPPRTLTEYFFSTHSLWFWFWTAFIVLTVVIVLLIPPTPPITYVRYIAGSVFVLFVPGYSLIEALYPKREELEPLERFALSIGLSLALVPLVGLVLNYTPWGIRLTPVTLSLSTLSISLLVVAVIRKFSYHVIPLELEEG